MPEDKIAALSRYAGNPDFTARECAALAWAEMVTIAPSDISDAQFEELRRHFSDREIMELTAQAAFENFRARLNRPLRIEGAGFADLPVERLPKAF